MILGGFVYVRDRHGEGMSAAIELPTPVIMPVAGVSYRQGIVRSLPEGTRVILKRDRDNEFDENAVAFYTLNGDHFGFVPRAIAARMVENDACERWGGEVHQVLRGETWGLRVRVTHSNVRDYPIQPVHTSFIEAQPAAVPPEDLPEGAEGPVAFSKSGRQLGFAVDFDPEAKTVKVATSDGDVRLFPAAVIIVKEPLEVC